MFGTEIESAYADSSYSSDPGMFASSKMSTPIVTNREDVDSVRNESARQEVVRQLALEQERELIGKESEIVHNEFAYPRKAMALPVVPNDVSVDTDQRIKLLERAVSQKIVNDHNGSSVGIFERYASKRRDVVKLLVMALTVLLALSAHHAISDLLRTYINNNDVTRNKETLLRFGYPTVVFLLLWSLKVFNK